jgi:predicted transcriptional regulator
MELPYFKFDVARWLIGRISFQKLDIQGAFLQACCLYWKLEGKMKDSDIDYRIGKKYLQKLKDLGFVKQEGDFLHVSFLDHQVEDYTISLEKTKAQASEAGKLGAKKRWENKKKIATDSDTITTVKKSIAKHNDRHKKNSEAWQEEERDKEEDKEEEKSSNTNHPSLNEVVSFFKEKGYTKRSAQKAFDYYEASDWHDSFGNKVHNWKQKMISVWFDEENKEPAPVLAITKKKYTVEEKDKLFGG